MIALAEVKPGDPDPTPTPLSLPYDEQCPEFHWLRLRHMVVCSRADSHEGPHIAGDGVQVLAVWP